jgi:hypothetical protein
MGMSDIKDYTAAVSGLDEMTLEQLHEIYSQMLTTAHDIAYSVPDDQLVETDDEEVLRNTIRALHPGIVKFNAGLDKAREETAAAKNAKPKKAAKKAAPKKTAKPGKTPDAEPSVKESNVAKEATAKKSAVKKAAKAAPAKKVAKKAAANARTPVARTKYSEKAVIKVVSKENPTKKGTGRFERVANLFKYDGKLVSDYLKKGGKAATLKFSADAGWVKVVG